MPDWQWLIVALATSIFGSALGMWIGMWIGGEVLAIRPIRRRDEMKFLLARALKAWQDEAGEGDGIEDRHLDLFEAACRSLGIAVVHTAPDRYRCDPPLDRWIAKHSRKEA
jgi:hypothetical protein